MAKALHAGSVDVHLKVTSQNRIRHAVVVSVTDQNTIVCRVGRTQYSATRGVSTTTRGTIFTAP